jgi:ADP-heptose:LPS heptosyltransferase
MNAYVVNFGGVGNGIMTMPVFQYLIANNIYDTIFCSENRIITNYTLTQLAHVHNRLIAVNSSWRRFDKNDWDEINSFLHANTISHIYNFRNENLELCEEFKKQYPEYDYFDLNFEVLQNRKTQQPVYVDIFNLFRKYHFDNSEKACEWLAPFRTADQRAFTIGFMVSASQQNKELPMHTWISLGKELLAKYPLLQILIFSGINDHELSFAETVVHEIQDARCTFVGKLDMIRTVEKMGTLSCFVSNDTGLLHACGALGLHAVGLYISTDSEVWKPNTFADFVSVTHPCVGKCMDWKPYAGTCSHFYDTCDETKNGNINDDAIVKSVERILSNKV